MAAVVLVVALLVGLVELHGVVRTHQRTDQAQARVDAAYAAVRPAADQRHQAGDEALTNVLGPATLRSSVVHCDLDEIDAGLLVEDWRQVCVLWTIDAYRSDAPVPELRAQLRRAAAAGARSGALLGRPADRPLVRGCGVLQGYTEDAAGPGGWSVVVSRLPAHGFDPLDEDGTRSLCHPPRQVYEVGRNQVEQRYDPASLDAGRTWVVVQRTEPVISLDLGCAGLLFCDLPTSGVLLPRS